MEFEKCAIMSGFCRSGHIWDWIYENRSYSQYIDKYWEKPVLIITGIVACQWLKLHAPNFHTLCSNSLPLKPCSNQVAKEQASRQFK